MLAIYPDYSPLLPISHTLSCSLFLMFIYSFRGGNMCHNDAWLEVRKQLSEISFLLMGTELNSSSFAVSPVTC